MAAEVVVGGIVSGVASKAAESSFDHIKREISHVFKNQNYVDDLKNQVQKLGCERETVQQRVNIARRQGDEICKPVKDWLTSVDQFTREVVQPIIEDENEAKKHCFKGLCPNFFRRYSLSKKAVKAAKDVTDLLSKGNFSSFSYRPIPERTEFMYAERDYQWFRSREKVFRDVMEALADSKVNMIGVHGMGGVGKTILAKLVAKKVMEDNLIFNEVVMVEVTHAPDLKIIQEKLASKLGLRFDQHDRADQLCRRLKQEKRVLVILDNIWGKLDLGAVGIPFGDDEKERKDEPRRCTVLLTSRDSHVLSNTMNCQKTFSIEVLYDEEAKSLFWNTVGDHSTITSDFQPLAGEIVRKCGGLPVAIKTIASALKNKRLHVWQNALNHLIRNSNPREMHEMDVYVYSSIECSYEFLKNEEAKSLFLLCGLLNGGSRITVSDLMRYGVGLGMFTNVYKLEAARIRVCALIDILKDSCLLLDGETANDVKMHDIIQDVAISIAAKKHMFNIRNVGDSTERLEDAIQEDTNAISLPYGDIGELPERLKCPKLKFFFLSAKYENSLQFPNLFFEGMEELRVLHLTEIPFSSLPSSLGCLTNLQTLSLFNCYKLIDVAIVGDQLSKLDILSLRGSGIEHLPVQIGQLTRLRVLDLGNCRSLVVIPPKVISNLSRLEELYLGNSFTQWEKGEGGSNSSLAELNLLSKLTTLEIHIEDATVMPPNLFSVSLVRFKIFIGEWGRCGWWNQWYDKDKTSRTLKFEGLDKKIYLGNEIKMLLKKSEDLDLLKLNDFQNIVHELDEEGFPQLKHLSLQNGPEILYIVSLVGQVCCNVFPLLESLVLRNLINLEKICHGQLTNDQSFGKLKIIRVSICDELQHLFSFSMAKNLLQLQEIEVTDCKKLKLIVGEGSENHNIHENESTMYFTQLHSLTLGSLPQLTSWGFNVEVSQAATSSASKEIVAEDDSKDLLTVLFSIKATFPILKKLELFSLNIEQIWLAKMSTSSCPNLTKLEVKNCNRLKFLFSYSMVNSFVHLQELVIENCKSMECVIDATEVRDEERMIKVMDFSKLNKLQLSGLPMLKRFISANSSRENNILYIDINTQPLFDEKVGFPSLETLSISSMSKLRKIWHHQLPSGSFSKLKDLTITSCYELMDVFQSNIIVEGRFKRLERLFIWRCDSIEVIIEEETSSKCTVDEKFPLASSRFQVFPQLTSLEICLLPNLKSIYQGTQFLEWMALECLQVTKCDKVEILFGSSELLSGETKNQQPVLLIDHFKVGVPSLETLQISNMGKLRKIWHHQLASGSFSKLKDLTITSCHELMDVFQSNIIVEGRFKRLERLFVWHCDSIEVIIEEETSSKCTVDEKFPSASSRFLVFPQLTLLDLMDLPNLKSIYQGTQFLEWTALECLEVDNCDKVEILFGSSESLNGEKKNQPVFLIDHSKVAFPNLKNLDIVRCDGLRNLTTLSTVESIVKLARIEIRYCNMIEEIIQQIGEVKDEFPVVFKQLVYLKLHNLPRLEHFCVGNFTLQFPYLKQVVVRRCLSMKIFSQGNLLTPNLQKVQLTNNYGEENEERWEGNLNSTVQKIFEEMAELHDSDKLILS